MAKLVNLIGNTFGRLTVLERDKERKGGTYWKCICTCGQERSVLAYSLTSGATLSCGCYNREVIKIKGKNKKYNEYNIDGNTVSIVCSSGDIILVDLDDLHKFEQYYWSKNKIGYAQARDCDTGKGILMHRLIMNTKDRSEIVDHINHNTLDNRKVNLRVCSQSKNMANQLLSKRNTSGHKGVSWNKEKNKWEARITFKRNKMFIGYFDNLDEAVEARREAELSTFGEYRLKDY